MENTERMEMTGHTEENLLKVISFNMKRDGFWGKRNRWAARRDLAAELIRRSGASIIGVQELLPKMRRDVEESLQDYSIIGHGRYLGKNTYNDEHSDIIVRNSDADVHYHKTFWLSKQPEKSGTRGLLALFPRICTMAEIYVKELDCRIRVFNTHFDCLSGPARTLGVRVILNYMSKYNREEPLPTILMGDMNATPDSKAIRILRENDHHYDNVHLNDVYEALGGNEIQNTYHFFKGIVKEGMKPIDYIFVSDEFEVVRSEICTDHDGEQYPSDHFPVMATLRLRQQAQPVCE